MVQQTLPPSPLKMSLNVVSHTRTLACAQWKVHVENKQGMTPAPSSHLLNSWATTLVQATVFRVQPASRLSILRHSCLARHEHRPEPQHTCMYTAPTLYAHGENPEISEPGRRRRSSLHLLSLPSFPDSHVSGG